MALWSMIRRKTSGGRMPTSDVAKAGNPDEQEDRRATVYGRANDHTRRTTGPRIEAPLIRFGSPERPRCQLNPYIGLNLLRKGRRS